jgi:hypothetical protein
MEEMYEYYIRGKFHKTGGLTDEDKSQVNKMYSEGIKPRNICSILELDNIQVQNYLKSKKAKDSRINTKYSIDGKLINPTIKECKYCNNEFNTYYEDQKYCNTTCRKEYYNIQHRKQYQKKPCRICGSIIDVRSGRCKVCIDKSHKRICEKCGIEFLSRFKDKYCSKECRPKSRGRDTYEKICSYCNCTFTTKDSNQIHCTRKCSLAKSRKSHKQFALELLEAHNGMLVPLTVYTGSDDKIECMCLKCGTIMNNMARVYTGCRKTGCSKCGRKSRGEDAIQTWLDHNGYTYAKQYSIDEVRRKSKLLFDFAIFNNDELLCLIEYDGVQHFEPIKRFGGVGYLEDQRARDNIKNEYCKDNNINLIRIPYTIEDINSYLNEMLYPPNFFQHEA